MKKENVQLKKHLSIEDKITLTKELSERHFIIGTDGKPQFAPYMAEIALITYFFVYCVDGLVFTYEMDSDGTNRIQEDVYAEISKDEELMALYYNFFSLTPEEAHSGEHRLLYIQMQSILNDVNRMVENKRQELVYKREDVVADFLAYLKQFLGTVDLAKLSGQLEAVMKYAQNTELPASVPENDTLAESGVGHEN